MEVLDGEDLYNLIYRRYTKDQRGWSFTISPSDRHGFFDALVTNPEEGWHLKLDTIFKPSPIVIGARMEGTPVPRSPVNGFPFGFRELQPSWLEQFGPHEGPGLPPQLTAALASMKPVVPRRGRVYAQGPFVLSGKRAAPKDLLELDERLSSEMLRRVRYRYPGYG